jgi:hypothetical protein
MPNFYDARLDMWNKSEREKAQARQTPHRHVNEGDAECEREFPSLYLSPRQAVLEKNIQGAGRMA